jgi:hypothetical protein
MADYSPIILSDDDSATYTVGATAVVGGNCVALSVTAGAQTNGSVIPTTAATPAFVGVAAFDAAVGAKVTVLSGGIQELISGAAITFGTSVKAAASGKVVTWVSGTDAADLIVGTALTTVGATDLPVRVKLKF